MKNLDDFFSVGRFNLAVLGSCEVCEDPLRAGIADASLDGIEPHLIQMLVLQLACRSLEYLPRYRTDLRHPKKGVSLLFTSS